VVLMGCRALLVAASASAVLVGPGVAAASADDTTPPAPGSQVTPSVSPPSQQQIEDARNAMDRLRHPGATRSTTPGTLTQVSGPLAGQDRGSVAPRITDQEWWTIGAGALVLLVASETTRLSVRRAKHRKDA
jgi:hypothetical protein